MSQPRLLSRKKRSISCTGRLAVAVNDFSHVVPPSIVRNITNSSPDTFPIQPTSADTNFTPENRPRHSEGSLAPGASAIRCSHKSSAPGPSIRRSHEWCGLNSPPVIGIQNPGKCGKLPGHILPALTAVSCLKHDLVGGGLFMRLDPARLDSRKATRAVSRSIPFGALRSKCAPVLGVKECSVAHALRPRLGPGRTDCPRLTPEVNRVSQAHGINSPDIPFNPIEFKRQFRARRRLSQGQGDLR